MNIFEFDNVKHLQILKEELLRAKRLMLEYNEEATWDDNNGLMNDRDRAQALLDVDDDLGPDLADEYMNTPWLEIPDTITNRINLRKWMSEPSSQPITMHIRSLTRGINNQIKNNPTAAKFVKAYLLKNMAQRIEELTSDQIKDLMDKLHQFQASLSTWTAPSEEEMEASNIRMKNIMDQDRIDNPGFSRD
jgi:hypothetical protein|tara:strand:+ start:2389 stop:2961 length:573 start_codon:yes stop_codon:yes gene_type:complete